MTAVRIVLITAGIVGALLMGGCAPAGSSAPAPAPGPAAKVMIGPPQAEPRAPFAARGSLEGDNATDFVPGIQVGETRAGTIYDEDSGQPGEWTLTLERSAAPFWVIPAWGREYSLTFSTDTMGWFYFRDASGQQYSLWVHNTVDDHTVYFSSSDPVITGLTQTS